MRSSVAVFLVLRGGSDRTAAGSVEASRGLRSWRIVREEVCEESWRSAATGREGSALVSTSAAKPFGCDGLSWAEMRGGSGRTGEVTLDSDVTLNTETSAHETKSSPARNRPVPAMIKIVIYQYHVHFLRRLKGAGFCPAARIAAKSGDDGMIASPGCQRYVDKRDASIGGTRDASAAWLGT